MKKNINGVLFNVTNLGHGVKEYRPIGDITGLVITVCQLGKMTFQGSGFMGTPYHDEMAYRVRYMNDNDEDWHTYSSACTNWRECLYRLSKRAKTA